MDDAAPVVNTLKRLHFGNIELIVLLGALMGMISSLLVFQLGQARVWFAMSRDGLLPGSFQPRAHTLSHPGFLHLGRRIFRRHSRRTSRYRHARRPLQYRHALRFRSGRRRRLDPSLPRAGPPPRVSCSRRPSLPIVTILTCLLLMAGLADYELDSFLRLAGHRPVSLPFLWPQAQPALRRQFASCGRKEENAVMRRGLSRHAASSPLGIFVLGLVHPLAGAKRRPARHQQSRGHAPAEMQPFFYSQPPISRAARHRLPTNPSATTAVDRHDGFHSTRPLRPVPVPALPRDYNAAIAKYNRRTLEQLRPASLANRFLQQETHRRLPRHNWDERKLAAAMLAHYVAAAHDPFNTTMNMRRQAFRSARRQRTVQSSGLVDRYQLFFFVKPNEAAFIHDPTDHAFEMTLERPLLARKYSARRSPRPRWPYQLRRRILRPLLRSGRRCSGPPTFRRFHRCRLLLDDRVD